MLNLDAIEARIKEYGNIEVLENGLTLVTERNPGFGLTRGDINIEVGAAIEKPEDRGAMHYLEHLIFSDSTHATKCQKEKMAQELGVLINASTGHSGVNFPVRGANSSSYLLQDKFPDAFELVLGSVMNPKASPKDVQRERAIIQQERMQRKHQKEGAPLFEQNKQLNQILYANNGWLEVPVIGTQETINNLDRETLLGYHTRAFAGKNMMVSIQGDVSELDLRKIKQQLETIPAGEKIPRVQFKEEEPFQGTKAVTLHYSGKQGSPVFIRQMFQVPSMYQDGNQMHLQLMVGVLGKGISSVLYDELREKRGLVYSVGASLTGHPRCAMLSIDYQVDPAKVTESLMATEAALQRIRNGDFDEGLIESQKSSILPNIVWSAKEPGYVINELLFRREWSNRGLDVNGTRNIEDMMSATKDDIVEMANQYLGNDKLIAFYCPIQE